MGGFGLSRRGQLVNLRPSVRRLVVLVALNQEIDRVDAAGALFPDQSSVRAQGNLRTVLWRLQDDCRDLVVDESGLLRLAAAEVDFAQVKEWSLALIHRLPDASAVPAAAGQRLLPTWGEEWLVEPREYLDLTQLHALEAAAERFLLAGRFGEAADCALRASSLDPLRESAAKLLIEVMLREGNTAEAMRRYYRFVHRLQREVNAEPGVALKALIAPLVAAGYTAPRHLTAR